MADKSKIEWTDATWNVLTGCSPVSEGCRNCYAAELAMTRLKTHPSRKGLARCNAAGVAAFTGEVRWNEEWLTQPLHWRKPRRIFVCAHGDLFHEAVPEAWIDQVFAVMALAPQHTFIVLTKRPERMRAYLTAARADDIFNGPMIAIIEAARAIRHQPLYNMTDWPLPNVWLGVSVEDQASADERIPLLLDTPAAKRWVSAEPLLGALDLTMICLMKQQPNSHRAGIHINALRGRYCESGVIYKGDWDVTQPAPPDTERRKLDWVVVGGESGRPARPMHPDWARRLRDQCAAAGVPFFFKQWGEWADSTDVDPIPQCVEDFIFKASGQVLGAGGRVGRKMHGMVEVNWREQGGAWMSRVGKKTAGHLLDGVEHRAFPT